MLSKKIFKPEIFQGNINMRNYFEGWYFKIADKEGNNVLAVIPGVSLGRNLNSSSSFVQILDGNNAKAANFNYPIENFIPSRNDFIINIGRCLFSRNTMELDIHENERTIKGKVNFKGITPWPVTLTSPGAMGWYTYVPFMECYHGILSFNHKIEGSLNIDGEIVDFTGGKGYMEKDWGKSFPTTWIWIQSNHFLRDNVSFTLSIANIPWLNNYFTGFIGGLLVHGTLFKFTTYTGASINYLKYAGENLYIEVADKQYILYVHVVKSKGAVLLSPKQGVMSGGVEETLKAEVNIKLYKKNGREKILIYEDSGENAGLEISGDISLLGVIS